MEIKLPGLCDSYEDWKHCITVKCKISLTADFLEQRIKALSKTSDPQTARFVEIYGDGHRARTLEWFKRAKTELEAAV